MRGCSSRMARFEYSLALISEMSHALGGAALLPPPLTPHIERVVAHLFQMMNAGRWAPLVSSLDSYPLYYPAPASLPL